MSLSWKIADLENYYYYYYYYYYHHHHHHLLPLCWVFILIFLRQTTTYVPRECSAAAILLLLFMVLISLVSVLNLLYFYIITFRSVCAVPNIAVFCSSLTSCFPAMLLMYFLNDFEIVPVASIITGIIFVFIFHVRSLLLLLLLLLLFYISRAPMRNIGDLSVFSRVSKNFSSGGYVNISEYVVQRVHIYL